MKLKIIFMVCLVLFFAAFCSCSSGDNKSTAEHSETVSVTNEFYALLSAYQTPADAVSIDMTAEDPSTDLIHFDYDIQGRINQCTYTIKNQYVHLTYRYQEDAVQIIATMSGWIVADETIELFETYSSTVGFSIIQGYYIKGFSQ